MQTLLDKIKDFVYSIDDHLVRWGKGLLALTAGTAMAAGGGAVADQQASPYMNVDADTRAVSIKQDLENAGEARVQINNNRPQAVLKKWNGEVQMSVSADIQATANRPLMSQKLRYEGRGNRSLVMQPTSSGFKIDGVFKQQPRDNTFTFNIDGAENLNFYYQPALNASTSSPNCTETTCFEERNGEMATTSHRPENVVGSYAVYHESKRDHVQGQTNYATGKAFHIYRPKIVDDAGNETWGEMRYQDGELSVTVPQSFLDKAVYPVVVDPTFGYETVGGSSREIARNDSFLGPQATFSASDMTLNEDGDLSQIQAYLPTVDDTTNWFIAIAEKTGSSPYSINELTTGTVSTTGWNVLSFSEILTSGTYITGAQGDPSQLPTDGVVQISYDSDVTGKTGYTQSGSQGNYQSGATEISVGAGTGDSDTIGVGDPTSGQAFSIYATYTADGGGGGVTPQSIYTF